MKKKANIYEQSDSSDFDDVQLEKTSEKTHFCIDNSGFCTILFLFFCYLLVLTFYFGTSIIAPNKLVKATEEVPVFLDEDTNIFDLDIRLSNLQHYDLLFDLNCTAVRKDPIPENVIIKFTINETHRFFEKEYFTEFTQMKTNTSIVKFKKNHKISKEFNLITLAVEKFDSFALSLSIQTNYTDFNSFQVTYYYVNPSSSRYLQVTQYIFSACAAFCLFIFILGKRTRFPNGFFCVVLGILTITASNPFSVFMPELHIFNTLYGCILMSLCVNWLRYFFAQNLIFIYNHSFNMNVCTAFGLFLYFISFTAIDSIASFKHEITMMKYTSTSNDLSPNIAEYIRIVYIVVYMGFLIMFLIFSGDHVEEFEHNRFVGIALFSIVPTLVCFITQIFFLTLGVLQIQIIIDMLYYASHMLAASCVLLLFRGVDGEIVDDFMLQSEYKQTFMF